MDGPNPLSGVAATAVAVARIRAEESQRADRLFNDPYAEKFVCAAPPGTLPEAHYTARVAEPSDIEIAFYQHGVFRTRFSTIT